MAVQAAQIGGVVGAGGGMAAAAPVIAVGAAAAVGCFALMIPCFAAYDRYVDCVDKRSWYSPICLPMFVATTGACVGMGASCAASGGVALKFISSQDVEKMKKILDFSKWKPSNVNVPKTP